LGGTTLPIARWRLQKENANNANPSYQCFSERKQTDQATRSEVDVTDKNQSAIQISLFSSRPEGTKSWRTSRP